MIAEFSVVPIGKGESVGEYVAECLRIVKASRLPYRLCPMGTVVEGSYDEVMEVVRQCHKKVMGMCGRAITTVKIDDRKGVEGAMDSKVESVLRRLENE